jgi:hypothetical protein
MQGTAALLLLLPPLLLLHAAAAGNGSCARSCGGLTVQYPFGFSPGCGIPLGCDDQTNGTGTGTGTVWLGNERGLGLLVSNVTARALLLALLPDCSRRLNASVKELFSDNYAPSLRNGLLVSSCSRAARARNCSVQPANLDSSSSHCFRGAKSENFSCVDPPSGNRFLNKTEIRALGSECTGLVSAASYWDSPGPAAILLGVMELEWWMLGPCSCAPNANCSAVSTPDSRQAFRCECLEGFEGDGFADGTGCRRGQYTASYSIYHCLFPRFRASLVELVSQIMRASDALEWLTPRMHPARGTRMPWSWTIGWLHLSIRPSDVIIVV